VAIKMMSEDEILQLLVDVKSGVKAFMVLLRKPPEEISRQEVTNIIDSVKDTLDQIVNATDSDPVAQNLDEITRAALSCCIKIYKQMQQGIDTDEAQEELQSIGAQFNQACKEFTEMVHKAFHSSDKHDDDSSSSRESNFNLNSGTINYVNNDDEFEEVLLIDEKYVVIDILDDSQQCQKMKSVFMDLARQYPKLLFCYINPNKAKNISYIDGITHLPHFQISIATSHSYGQSSLAEATRSVRRWRRQAQDLA